MVTTIHVVATVIGAILGIFIGIFLYAESPNCKIGWGFAGILVGVIVINFWASMFSVPMMIGSDKAKSESQKSNVKNLEIEVPDVNHFGTITVYDIDGVIYSYQGEVEILNDGTNGQPIEVVLDINENVD